MTVLSLGIAARQFHSAQAWRRTGLVVCLVVALAGCTGSAASSPTISVAGATATPTAGSSANSSSGSSANSSAGSSAGSAANAPTSKPAATSKPVATSGPAATSHATSQPTPTTAATTAATPTQTPPSATLPPSIGLCSAAQLAYVGQSWQRLITGVTVVYITLKNASSTSCNVVGTPQAQLIEGGGTLVADSGKAPSDKHADTLAPNGQIKDVITWANQCQPLTVKTIGIVVTLPSPLGQLSLPTVGASGLLPTCTSSGSPNTLSAQPWAP